MQRGDKEQSDRQILGSSVGRPCAVQFRRWQLQVHDLLLENFGRSTRRALKIHIEISALVELMLDASPRDAGEQNWLILHRASSLRGLLCHHGLREARWREGRQLETS